MKTLFGHHRKSGDFRYEIRKSGDFRYKGRRGMSVIVVLGVISITLALSYAMLRSQVTSVEIQSNLERRNLARQAAYAGISAALQEMHAANWAGVESTPTKTLSDNQWFEVSYATGDESLLPTDPDYAEYPFRVTITSVGYAADPAQPDVRATYRVSAVVELVREKLYAEPTAWAFVKNFTAYQWSNNLVSVEFPVRVQGPVWVQGSLAISTDYPIDSISRSSYLDGLTAMKNANQGDYRPFNGPIVTPNSKQTGVTMNLLQNSQQLTVIDVPVATGAPVAFPTNHESYRLYPGGKSYPLPVLQATYGNTLSGVTLAADPKTNPLGVFLSNGTLFVNDNVTVNGSIITTGSEPDIRVVGRNITLQANTLPLLNGSTTVHQLPVAIVKDDFQLLSGAAMTVRGAVVAYDEFSFIRGDSTSACDLQGRVASSKLLLNGRIPWDLSLIAWQLEHTNWTLQKLLAGGIPWYPKWLKQTRGFDPDPLLKIYPPATAVTHYWHTWGEPVYVPAVDGEGLQWNLINWNENPPLAN